MITMKELEAPVRQWVSDWLGFVSIFIVILPVTMLNGSYTGSMLEVSNTLGTNSEDITIDRSGSAVFFELDMCPFAKCGYLDCL